MIYSLRIVAPNWNNRDEEKVDGLGSLGEESHWTGIRLLNIVGKVVPDCGAVTKDKFGKAKSYIPTTIGIFVAKAQEALS